MKTNMITRRSAAVFGAVAIVAMGALTACGGGGNNNPSSTTTTTTTTTSTTTSATTPAAPSQNQINPTGGNLFTPAYTPAPTIR